MVRANNEPALAASTTRAAEYLQCVMAQVCAFCDVADFQLGIVPSGALLTPPATNEFDDEAFEELRNAPQACEDSGEAGAMGLAAERQHLEHIYEDGEDGVPAGES